MNCCLTSDFTLVHNIARKMTNCLIPYTYCVLVSYFCECMFVPCRHRSCKQQLYCQIIQILKIALCHLCMLYNLKCGYCCFSQVFLEPSARVHNFCFTLVPVLLSRLQLFVPNIFSVHCVVCLRCCLEEYFVQPNKAVFGMSFYFNVTVPFFVHFVVFPSFLLSLNT